MTITLYKSLTCPQCKVIQAKLDKKGIAYEMVTDVDYMTSIGVKSIPQLHIDNDGEVTKLTKLTDINKWVNAQEAQNG
jgi:glutaredoxin